MCGPNRRTRVLISQDYQGNEYQEISPVNYQIEKDFRYVVDTNYTFCHKCNFAQNTKNADFCQQCGNELQVCPISKMKFSSNQEFVQCMNCNWIFHKSHMDNWMVKKRSCPICNGAPEDMIVGHVGINLS